MKKLNNKGQSLILFVLLLPIMIGVMALVIDCGNAMITKHEINNVIEMILDYSFSNKTDNIINEQDNDTSTINQNNIKSLEVLLEYNLPKYHNEVSIDENKILIKSNTYVEGIFSKIFGFKGFKIESIYKCYKDNSKIIKEKIK